MAMGFEPGRSSYSAKVLLWGPSGLRLGKQLCREAGGGGRKPRERHSGTAPGLGTRARGEGAGVTGRRARGRGGPAQVSPAPQQQSPEGQRNLVVSAAL